MAVQEDSRTYGYRWVVLSVFMLVTAITQLLWLNFAPITSQTQKLLGLSEFRVVLLATMYPLLYIIVSIPAGIIIDRRGYRYAVMVGAALTAAFAFVRIFVSSYPLLLLGSIGLAVGQPFVMNSVTKVISTWFSSDESATATGLASLSLFLGMILALALTPPMLKAFGEGQVSSLRYICLIYALVALVGFGLFALLARARPPVPPRRTEHELISETAAINWGSLREIFRLRDFGLLCGVLFIGMGSFIGVMQLLEKILKPKGISTGTAGNIGAVMVMAGVAGCVIIPALSDRLGRRKPFIALAFLAGIPTIYLLGAVEGVPGLFPAAGALGFFLLTAYPLVLTYSEEITGAHLTGSATAILLLLGNAGGVVVTMVMEAIKGATGGTSGSFHWAVVFAAAFLGLALVLSLFLKESRGAATAPGIHEEPLAKELRGA